MDIVNYCDGKPYLRVRKYFLFKKGKTYNWSNNTVSAQKNQVNKEDQPEPLEHAVGL